MSSLSVNPSVNPSVNSLESINLESLISHVSEIAQRYYLAHLCRLEYFDELVYLLQIVFNQPKDSNGIRSGLRSTVHELLRKRELLGEQKSTEWLSTRNNYITASVSAACAGIMGPVAREMQLLEKASNGKFRSFYGNYYTDKGNLFEPVTNQIYMRRNGTKIHAYGLIPCNRAEYGFLAASTDGVTDELCNIEIKTLASREIDGRVKKEYHHQMQHQMYCLGLDKTDFLEAKYAEYEDAAEVDKTKDHGTIVEYYNCKERELRYVYLDGTLTPDGCGSNPDSIYIRTIYWNLTAYACVTVKRDPDWIVTVGPLLRQFWNEVNDLKQDPTALERRIACRSKGPDSEKCLL